MRAKNLKPGDLVRCLLVRKVEPDGDNVRVQFEDGSATRLHKRHRIYHFHRASEYDAFVPVSTLKTGDVIRVYGRCKVVGNVKDGLVRLAYEKEWTVVPDPVPLVQKED